MSAHSHITDCGLPGIKEIPYGVHMCHFYGGAPDLGAALVPYFKAGLRENERCLWITAEPLDGASAKIAMQDAGVDVEAAERRGALVIRDHSQWYTGPGLPQPQEIIDRWLDEERRALADGFAGLRITGNVSFLTPETWPDFMLYEQAAGSALQGRRIVTLCSYQLSKCGASDVLDVVRRHDCTLDHPDVGWQILTHSSYPGVAPR